MFGAVAAAAIEINRFCFIGHNGGNTVFYCVYRHQDGVWDMGLGVFIWCAHINQYIGRSCLIYCGT